MRVAGEMMVVFPKSLGRLFAIFWNLPSVRVRITMTMTMTMTMTIRLRLRVRMKARV